MPRKKIPEAVLERIWEDKKKWCDYFGEWTTNAECLDCEGSDHRNCHSDLIDDRMSYCDAPAGPGMM